MCSSRLRLITFDVTDTLLKFKTSPAKQYGEIGALYGVEINEKQLSDNFKTHWRRMNEEHPNFGLRSGIGWENWWKTIVKGAFQDSKPIVEDKQLDEVAEQLINLYKTSVCWQYCSGAQNLLSYVRSKGIPMGIISNFDPRLSQLLGNMKLSHFFQFVITSYDIGIEKPNKKIFEEAMFVSKIDNLKTDECLHIGNKLFLDYHGAINSGWQAALIDTRSVQEIRKEYSNINSDHLFANLNKVLEHFIQTSGCKIKSHKF